MNRPTVFIVQEPTPDRITGQPTRDFTPAERYGRLRVLLPHDAIFYTGDELYDQLMDAGLVDFKEGDSLVLAGHPATIGVATAIVAMDHPVRLLIWSGRKREYDPIEIDLRPLSVA